MVEIKNRYTGAVIRTVDAADLSWANLIRADLTGADLSGANLFGADLTGADLIRANLEIIKADIFEILSHAPREVAGLRLAILEGRIDGSTYEGPCACLVGTIAILQECPFENVPGIPTDYSRPAERFFTGIRKGDTPETNTVSAIVLGWIDEWIIAHPTTA